MIQAHCQETLTQRAKTTWFKPRSLPLCDLGKLLHVSEAQGHWNSEEDTLIEATVPLP